MTFPLYSTLFHFLIVNVKFDANPPTMNQKMNMVQYIEKKHSQGGH